MGILHSEFPPIRGHFGQKRCLTFTLETLLDSGSMNSCHFDKTFWNF